MTVIADGFAGQYSSGELPAADHVRYEAIEQRQQQIADFLAQRRMDALLLQHPANFAWFTCGGDSSRRGLGEPAAALFITPEARVLVCGNTETDQLFDIELPGLGFQLKERPWYEPKSVLISDLCRGRRVASDSGFEGTLDVSSELATFRVQLSDIECDRMRTLGKAVAHALEATARGLEPGRTEAEIAGEISHRLLKHQTQPVRIQVIGDRRGARYRHWSYSQQAVCRGAVLSAIGSRWGLSVSASRTVWFGRPDADLLQAHQHAAMVEATCMYFSQMGWQHAETFERIRRIYEKFGHPDEWRLADQGCILGYRGCEFPVLPHSRQMLLPQTAVDWHPSVGPAHAGDTILVTSEGFELLTPCEYWPTIEVAVKDSPISCPGIYCRGQ